MDQGKRGEAIKRVFCGFVGVLAAGCSSDPGNRVIHMLPADGEVEDWRRVEEAILVRSDTDLYNQIDGAAPKYIDRGWQQSTFATYGQGTATLQVAIHDMGSPANAEALFNLDLPVSRVAVQGLPNAVVDLGLPSAYRALAWTDRYYVEVAIDERSDAALASIEAFTAAIVRP